MNTNLSSLLRRGALVSAVAAILGLTSGCFLVAVGAAGAAGAGTVAYVKGELDAELGHGLDHATSATEQAIAQLQFAKVNERRDAISTVMTVRTAEDKKIDLTLTREGDHQTKLAIRVGVFGDEALSRSVLEKIKANL